MDIKSANLNKYFHNLSAAIGLIAGIGSIIIFFLRPTIETWIPIVLVLTSLISFLIFYLVLRGFLNIKLRSAISDRRIPIALHSDWNINYKKIKSLSKEIDTSKLKKNELASLILLIADRLHTGAWSKTLVARFVRSNKSLSPAGSLTGTYMVLESLRFYRYHQDKKNIGKLLSNLARLLSVDGSVIHSLEQNSSGGFQKKIETLRHSSAFLLLRPLQNKYPSHADKLLINYVRAQLGVRLETRSKDDLQGTAFGLFSLLSSMFWAKNQFKDEIHIIRSFLNLLCEQEEIFKPGHYTWGNEPGAAAASNTAAQWIFVWLISRLLSWKGTKKGTKISLADKILSLIESNISLIPSKNNLLPHSFSGTVIRIPKGESMLATGIALYVSYLFHLIFRDKKILERSKICILNLIDRISLCGFRYSTEESLKDPIEGYLAWSASLLCMYPIIYTYKEQEYASNILNDAISFITNPKSFSSNSINNNEKDFLVAAIYKIDQIYDDANAKVYKNGYFQPLNDLIIEP